MTLHAIFECHCSTTGKKERKNIKMFLLYFKLYEKRHKYTLKTLKDHMMCLLTVIHFSVISDSCIWHNSDSATCVAEALNSFPSEHEPQSSRPEHAQLQWRLPRGRQTWCHVAMLPQKHIWRASGLIHQWIHYLSAPSQDNPEQEGTRWKPFLPFQLYCRWLRPGGPEQRLLKGQHGGSCLS